MRALLAGSKLNEIWGSLRRYPGVQVLVWNPLRVTINDVATGQVQEAPLDLSDFLENLQYEENIGFENGGDPSIPQATFTFRRSPGAGRFRRGWIEDGVIVQIRQGDKRVEPSDWLPIFTGTFRGRPGDNPGTRSDESEGFQSTAYGREERYKNVVVTTKAFPGPVDVGSIAYEVAWKHMDLGQDEILFGTQGFDSQHSTNQIVDTSALEALYQCLFPVGKKPKFAGDGRLVAVDVNLEKPAARIYTEGNVLIERCIAAPNDVEVANQVLIKGLDHNLTKIIQEAQLLTEFEVVTGFFDSQYDERIYYSQDHSQRAQETVLHTKKRITFSGASWSQIDEFHGRVKVDTKFLRNARLTIFSVWLVSQIAVSAIDFYIQSGGNGNTPATFLGGVVTLAELREILYVISQLAMAGLLAAMQFIGRGKYEVWGKPFEFVYQELVSDNRLTGLDPEELRLQEYRNDFVSTMEDLDSLGRRHLRRELLKNQLFDLTMMDDPLLEVDDVIELTDGSRYYIVSVQKSIKRDGAAVMRLTCWKISDPVTSYIEAISHEEVMA